MTIKNSDTPEMPVNKYKRSGDLEVSEPVSAGLTKREMMAMHMASGILNGSEFHESDSEIALKAVRIADALLAELERTK